MDMPLAPFALNLRHLRALPAIVAKGSLRAGAEAVSLSQPALTQGIARLEQVLGATLFERRSDGATPTPEGAVLALRVEAALAQLAKATRRSRRGFARPELLMTAAQLRAFLALADAGGFAPAAAATGQSQPALHRAVRDLEQLCGIMLVERRGRGVALTAQGHRLARGTRLAAREIAAGIAEITGEASDGGAIVIGAMPLSRAHILPRAVARFTAEYPHVRIDIVEGSWRELAEPLLDGILDLTIGALRDAPPAGLAQSPLMTDQLAVIGRAGHPLAAQAVPARNALAACSWIVGQQGTPLRAQWELMFEGGALPHAPIECGSVVVIREMLRDSDFLTLLSRDQVALEIATGNLTTIGPPLEQGRRTIGVSTRREWRPTPPQARLLALIREAAGPGLQQNQ